MAIRPDPPLPEPTPGVRTTETSAPPSLAPPPADTVSAAVHGARLLAIRSGSGWLVMIGLLTLVNVVLTVARSDFSFAVGLVLSQLIAAVGVEVSQSAEMSWLGLVGGVVAVVPAIAFAALSIPSKAGKPWAFVVAMGVYTLDFVVLLVLLGAAGEMDLVGVGIHVWALWALWRGWSASRELRAAQSSL